MKNKILVVSLPRSGSSMLANLIGSSGYSLEVMSDPNYMSASEFNKDGYFEEVGFTLLNDQLIKLYFGSQYSFLYAPKWEDLRNNLDVNFNYDVDENSIYFPPDFESKISYYTGKEWDVWGLTRMRPGGKWHKCYRKYTVDNYEGILNYQKSYENAINNSKTNIVVKDPRLGFTLFSYKFDPSVKIIFIKRNYEKTLKSMRNHYGPRLFTSDIYPGTDIVSNHFNYHIKPQSFEDYYSNYEEILNKGMKKYQNLTIEYDKILSGEDIPILEDFISSKIDRSKIRKD